MDATNGASIVQLLRRAIERGGNQIAKAYNLFGVILCLAAAGCASLPQTFTCVDGRAVDPKELSVDQAICRDEIKDSLSTGNQTTIWGPTEDAITVYAGCMAQHGYKAGK